MSNYTFAERCRYRFDNFMARGGRSIFISLTVVFIVLLVIVSVLRGVIMYCYPEASVERDPNSFLRGVYTTFLQMTDPGNMNQDVNSAEVYKISAIIAGFSGVIMLSMLIAFITTALDQKINQLKKGRSRIIERDQTVVLGWNERIIEILRELFLANESEDDPVVVILANQDKEEMDDFIKANYPSTFNTRVVTRSGSPSSLVDLDIVSIDTCKAVICLAECNISASVEQKEISDTSVIKTVLALVASRSPDAELNIVAEVFFERHRKIVEDIAPGEVTTVDTSEILAKILVQTSRSVGLSVVYGEVLSFDGCEMYFHESQWNGMRWENLPYHFLDGIPMGIRHADGSLSVNPPIDTVLQDDDSILILAEDDSTIELMSDPVATPRDFPLAGGRKEVMKEKNLIIGWTEKVEIIIREYADYVMAGSDINIMLRMPDESVQKRVDDLNKELDEVNIRVIEENPLRTEGLLAAKPFEHDNIIILSQGGKDSSEDQTDSETIMILLLLRQIFKQEKFEAARPNVKLITEILDSENQSLVARTGVNDFIISNRFISMILAQISEDADIKRVYDDLFSEDGSEIYLKPIELYFSELPIEVSYADMIRIAQKREEICLGVKIKAFEEDMDRNFGVELIPEKNKTYTLNEGDAIVVLAEDET